MEFRINLQIRVSEEIKEQFESKTNEYFYDRGVNPKYSEHSNVLNYIGFCSYSKNDKWIIYGRLVEFEKFELEINRFKNYLNYIGMNDMDYNYEKDMKLIIRGDDNPIKIKTIQNLMNLYFNYRNIIKKTLRLGHISIKEEEIDNLNELVDITEELPKDIIDLAIEDKEYHRLESPIDLTNYPFLIIKGYELDFDSIKMYFQFILSLIIKSSRNISIRKNSNNIDNEKYEMRNLLRNLGFNGNSYKKLRRFFLQNLSGNLSVKTI